MIRKATIEDIKLIFNMCLNFAEASEYNKYVEPLKILGVVNNLLSDPNSVIFLYEDKGMLAATSSTFVFGDVLLATEVAWWVEPEARGAKVGLELIKAFEDWAKSMGCPIISMSCLDDKVAGLYEKNNYKLYERSYFKEL